MVAALALALRENDIFIPLTEVRKAFLKEGHNFSRADYYRAIFIVKHFSSKYYFYFWIVHIGIIVFLIKIYKKYKKHGSSSDDYYFKLEKALLDFITYANIGKPIEFSMKNFLLKKTTI